MEWKYERKPVILISKSVLFPLVLVYLKKIIHNLLEIYTLIDSPIIFDIISFK